MGHRHRRLLRRDLTHCTAAAIAGGNPERMQRLPNLTGLKNEVIVPAYSHNVYDHAIRMLGVKLVIVKDKAELEAAFNERTAMVVHSGRSGRRGSARHAGGRRGRASGTTCPSWWMPPPRFSPEARTSTCSAARPPSPTAEASAFAGRRLPALLLGEKDLLQAAWINSAPHHAFGRSVKVGKEEIMGMLAAVEMWVKRDHKAEWAQWEVWLDQIAHVGETRGRRDHIGAAALERIFRTAPRAAESNGTPPSWASPARKSAKMLLDTEPRIVVAGAGARAAVFASCRTR